MGCALGAIAHIITNDGTSAAEIDWGSLRYEHTQLVRAVLQERYQPATANRHLAALRGVLREAWRLGLTSAEQYHRAIDIGRVRGQSLPPGRALSAGEMRALFSACAQSMRTRRTRASGARDAALLAVLYGGGLRRAEAVALGLCDYDATDCSLKVRRGKGRKGRIVYLGSGATSALDGWLSVRGSEDKVPLFVPINKSGRIVMRSMTTQALLCILRRRARQAGVRSFSPHDLRRTHISDLLDAGVDIATVQRLAGHASPETTSRYDRRGEETKRHAASLLHVPFLIPDP
jgi:integrase